MKKNKKESAQKPNLDMEKFKKQIADLEAKCEALKLKNKKLKKRIDTLVSKISNTSESTDGQVLPTLSPIRPSSVIPSNFGAWA